MVKRTRFFGRYLAVAAALSLFLAVGCREREPAAVEDQSVEMPATAPATQPADEAKQEEKQDLIAELAPPEPQKKTLEVPEVIERPLIGEIELNDAAANGDLEKIKALLKQPVPVPVNDHKGNTPIHYAAMFGHVDVMKYLLERMFDPHAPNRENVRPIHWAALGGYKEAVQLLLEWDADVDAVDNNGLTPMFAAARGGNPDVIRLLLDHGANVNVVNAAGDTPLIVAASHGRTEAVKELIKAGADVNAQDKQGQTALFRAVDLRAMRPQLIEMVEALLIGEADPNISDERGWSPTDAARMRADIPMYELLRSYGGVESRVSGPPLGIGAGASTQPATSPESPATQSAS